MAIDEKDAFYKKLGNQVKKLRKEKGLTLGELGLRGDLDKHVLSRVENGKKKINVYSLNKICEALEITPEEFFKGF